MMNERLAGAAPVPAYVLTGFLGSGKTTLLTRLLERLKSEGKRPAVIMNELGDINLDGQLVEDDVPMAEMLSGCICCSMRGDLGLTIDGLIRLHRPDAIVIEATGAANPMELLDGVTEAAMYHPVELRSVIAVVDGPQLLARSRDGKGRTFKLMRDQIRCGTVLLLNKTDKLAPEELVEAQQLLREFNAYAPILPTVRSDCEEWDVLLGGAQENDRPAAEGSGRSDDHSRGHADSADGADRGPDAGGEPSGEPRAVGSAERRAGRGPSRGLHATLRHHHSHDHVMTLTHYLHGPVDSEAFERLLNGLPDEIYRAKGIVSFSDTSRGSRFLFQYAYKETDFIRIEPQGEVLDVAVFIGEHFSREELLRKLQELEDEENRS